MEALPITPAKASHQPAKPQAERGLGDVFQVLLHEATFRLDARSTVLAGIETHRVAFDLRSKFEQEAIPSIELGSRSRAPTVHEAASEDPAEATPTRSERTTVDDESQSAGEAAVFGVGDAPVSTTSDDTDDFANDIDGHPQASDDGFAEPASAQSGDETPETAATTGVAVPAQRVAADIAVGKAQALGAGDAALQALAQLAATPQIVAAKTAQAQLATSATPSVAVPVGANGAATRVEVTPAALVAQPNAALGGGAALAALAAEAGQEMAASKQANQSNGTAPTASQAGAAAPATLSAAQIQARPLARAGQNSFLPSAHAQGGEGEVIAQTVQGSAAEVRNDPTAAAQNGLTRSARAETAQTQAAASLGAPVPSAEIDEAQTKPNATNAKPQRAAQTHEPGQRPGNEIQSVTNQGARTDAAAHGARLGGAVPGNATVSTSNVMDRAATPASVHRAEGAGQVTANTFGAGTIGMTQAAAHTPQSLPAQARPAAIPTLAADQVAVHIQRAAAAGQDRIRIRLHPAELGQIEVRLKVASDGIVRAIVSVDRPETLELLQRDARGLERALQDAGLKTDSGSLNFNLRGESELGSNSEREGLEFGAPEVESEPGAEPQVAPEMLAAENAASSDHALDMHV